MSLDRAACVLIGILSMPMAAWAEGTWVSGQAAQVVLGQPDFDSRNSPLSASWFGHVSGVAVDPTTAKVFVVDTESNRIMRFSSVAAFTSGANAEAWFGQPTSTATALQTPSAKTFNVPQQIHIDSDGRMWVPDRENHRVLRFDNASSKASFSDADGVLGQPNTSFADRNRNGPVAANSMSEPSGVWHDAVGLWVADSGNNRVLGFSFPENKPNGIAADIVLGQQDFTHSVASLSAGRMHGPTAIVVRGSTMFVADTGNARVVRFDGADQKVNGDLEDGSLGGFGEVSATTMNAPLGVALDSVGRLYVADSQFNRVLIFNDAAHKPNGSAADNVLGQPDFETYVPASGTRGMNGAESVAFDTVTNALWVGDYVNDRALAFSPFDALLDVDASVNATKFNALTDGLLILRYMFGLTGVPLTKSAVGATATRTDPVAIKAYLDGIRPALDVDYDGTISPLTDGIMILRYLFGLRGNSLTSGTIGVGAQRDTNAAIEAYIQSLMQ